MKSYGGFRPDAANCPEDRGKQGSIMKRANKDKFEGNEFEIQLMSKGSFVDNGYGHVPAFLIEAFTIRLNHIALNDWVMSEMMNVRECYGTNEEWEEHKTEIKEKHETWNRRIIEALDIDLKAGSASITQSKSEIFTVVYIRKIAQEE